MRKCACFSLLFCCLLAGPVRAGAIKTFNVEKVKDVLYCEDDTETASRHKLDLFLPQGCENFPVLIFVHGGGWRHGDKGFLGIYAKLGESLARDGIGVAVPNYRLSPKVQHPEHVKDVARAFAWVQRNIRKYHGDPDRLFVCGHSAGGHLCALLATDDRYLRAEGLSRSAIKGVIPMSGVYKIPDTSWLFNQAFGPALESRKDASPLEHVQAGLPPFLVIYADNELPYCGKDDAEAFVQALRAKQCKVRSVEVSERTHMSLIVNASKDRDPVGEACRSFIDECCKLCAKPSSPDSNPSP
jgi:acetyl esterase/lipase